MASTGGGGRFSSPGRAQEGGRKVCARGGGGRQSTQGESREDIEEQLELFEVDDWEEMDVRNAPKFLSIQLSLVGLRTLDLRTGGAGLEEGTVNDLLRDNVRLFSGEDTRDGGEFDRDDVPEDTE